VTQYLGSEAAHELWAQAVERIHAARGWSLLPLTVLGSPREDPRTSPAKGEQGPSSTRRSRTSAVHPYRSVRLADLVIALSARVKAALASLE